ncbi:MAG: SAM-dependent methyltransferase [Kofleriaceae bacterium]
MSASPATRAAWASQFTATARAHWTPARTEELARGKQLAVLPAEAPLLLRALGLLHRDGTMPPPQVRKFLQINHMVRLLEPAVRALAARHPVVRLVDAGCGRSYLTLLVAWCARARWQLGGRLEVLGVDRDPAVIDVCRARTELAQLDDVVRFEAAPLAELELAAAWQRRFGDVGAIHGVVALHACDRATCDAIALGVGLGAELIAVAPCCQAELAAAWRTLDGPGPFAPVWRAPHLRRELAAHVTDTLRVLLLRGAGYQVTPMEFIGAEHTKKNTLLRAARDPADAVAVDGAAAHAEYHALVAATGGAGLALAARLGVAPPP